MCMPVPTQSQLDDQKKDLQLQLSQLKAAYAQFVAVWEKLEETEKDLLAELHQHIDKNQIHSLLHTIDSLKH